MSGVALTRAQVAEAWREACRFDVVTFKPGNVSCAAPGHGMEARDFLKSAAVAEAAIAQPGASVGERVLGAVTATRAAVGCNTNLGIVLLAAPLASAALERSGTRDLQARVAAVLSRLTPADAEATFAAIRLANPGGLGEAQEADVQDAPAVDLRHAMALAADRDTIALQYTNGYREIFGMGVPALHAALATQVRMTRAVFACYGTFLTRLSDTHIARKHGRAAADAVRDQAVAVAGPGKACQNPGAFSAALRAFDRALKAGGRNPGTTADLTVASLFAAFLACALLHCRASEP